MQPAPVIGLSETMEARFRVTMFRVWQEQQRRIEEHLLGFRHRHAVLVILSCIAFVPFEANDV